MTNSTLPGLDIPNYILRPPEVRSKAPNTALITGSAGFLGKAVVPALYKAGYALTTIDPRNDGDCLLGSRHYQHRCTFQNWCEVRRWPRDEEFDVVLHLGANLTKSNIDSRNKMGVAAFDDITLDYAMAQYLERWPPRQRAVWMSSCAVDARDTENYAFVKYVGERFATTLAQKGVPITILRPFSGYGPGQSLEYPFPAILQRVTRHDDPVAIWGNTETVRDWIYIDDLVRAIVMAVEGAFPIGEAIDIGTGDGKTFVELVQIMSRAVGYHPKVHTAAGKPIGSLYRVADISRGEDCGFHAAISLEDGIHRVINSLK